MCQQERQLVGRRTSIVTRAILSGVIGCETTLGSTSIFCFCTNCESFRVSKIFEVRFLGSVSVVFKKYYVVTIVRVRKL